VSRRAGLALAAALSLAGCGRKLPPLAPLQVIPARVEPLDVSQEGSDVVLRFPYPSKTAQGEDLTALTRVTVLRDLMPAPPGARPPVAPADAASREREEKTFLARARPVAVLTPSDLADYTSGGSLVVRDSLYPLAADRTLGKVFLRYGVTATRDRKKTSELSPIVTLQPRVPPASPGDLVPIVEEGRVCLEWTRPTEMLGGSGPVVVAGYAVFRRDEKEPEYPASPTGVALEGERWIDENVTAGKRYVYTVRAAPVKETPLVLGPPAREALADTRDVFPPKAPEGLLVLSEGRANRLVWNPVLARDLAGYRVYRLLGAALTRLAEVKEPVHVDSGAPPGARYAVTAFDTTGNESAPTQAATGR
jgi:hypothetical protein